MLNHFRHQQIHLISTLLIVFAIVAKMLVPIAHASNASGGQKGFLASLCTGNEIVFVAFDLPTNQEPQPATVVASNQCPLCNIIAQDPPTDVIAVAPFSFETTPQLFGLTDNVRFQRNVIRLSAIRAPPSFS